MDNPDIRWKQRFQNFEKAFKQLARAVEVSEPSELERAGIIQFYEFTFELAWKTLKDYLKDAGYLIKSPRETIKQAFQNGYIENGHLWLKMLEKRNDLAHAYKEEIAAAALKLIQNDYFNAIQQVYTWLKTQINDSD